MSDNIGPPTIETLITELNEITEWKIFGAHLSFSYADLEKIQLHSMLKSVDDYKLHMFGKWLERGTNTTWRYIVNALSKSGYNALAKAVCQKYSSVIDELACPVNSCQPQLQNSTTAQADTEPDVIVEKSVVETLTEFESEFASMVVNTQEKCNDIISKLLLYLKNCLSKAFKSRLPLSNSPDACEILFDVLSDYWDCLRISPLNEIITKFLKEDVALNSDLTKYNANFDSFKKSTKLRDLVDVIKRKQSEKGPTKPVILKLGRLWEDVTLEHFKCLIELLFYELNEQMYGLQVTAGSVFAEWLIPDDETVTNLIIAVSSLSSNTLRLCGVLYLQIGNQIIWKDKECTISSANDGLVKALQLQDVCAVELFLSIGADPHIELPSGQLAVTAAIQLKDPLDSTVLHTACQHGHLETAELLIAISISLGLQKEVLNRADALGYTPLAIATTNGHHSLAELLSNNGAVSMISTQSINTNILEKSLGVNETQLLSLNSLTTNNKKYIGIIRMLFHFLIESIEIKSAFKIPEGHCNIAELLKESRTIVDALYSNDQGTALYIACDKGQLKLVSLLLSIGANINAVTERGTTPLMVACKSRDHGIVQRLLQQPTIDVNAVDLYGWSALHFSVYATLNIVTALVTKGANPNIKDKSCRTPLDYAIRQSNIDVVSALLQSVQKLPTHEIPIHLACKDSTAEVVDVLIQYGADINRKLNGMTPLMVACKRGHYGIVQRLLQEPNIDIDAVESISGKSALHFAILTSEIVTALVTKGANPNIMDESGFTPLYYAIRHKNIDVVSALLQSVKKLLIPLKLACEKSTTEVVDVLIQYGADVNRKYNGMTPLMVACKRGHYGIVQRLLQEPNIDIDAVESISGKSALHFAILTSEIVTALVTKGANPNIGDKSSWTPLDYAIKYSKIDTISALLQSPYQLDCVQKLPSPVIPLHLACEKSTAEVVDVLIQYGVDVNGNHNGMTPLMVACKRGHYGIVQRLLQEPNIDIDAVHVESISGKSALHFAILTSEIVTALVTKCANPNIRDKSGWTPLDYAIKYSKIDTISALLQSPYQFDCVQKLPAHEIPIHLACEEGTLVVIDVLIQYGADINRKHNGMTPLMVACKSRHYKIVQRLLQEPTIDIDAVNLNGWSALHFAVFATSKFATALVTKGANPNIMDESGITPLYYAIRHDNIDVVSALLQSVKNLLVPFRLAFEESTTEVVDVLIQYGFDVNRKRNGMTPLMVACKRGHYGIVQRLLQEPNIDIDAVDSISGKSALHFAILTSEIVTALVTKGGNPNIRDTSGLTPLDYAIRFDKIDTISALLQSPYQLDCVQKLPTYEIAIHLACEKSTAEVIDVLIQYGADVNWKYMYKGMTPLMVACKRGHYGIVQRLLQEPNIDIDAVESISGKSALHFAILTSEIVTTLVTKGANPNIMDGSGCTPLDYAIRHDNIGVVSTLLQSVKELLVPLHLACEKSSTEVVDALIQNGADVNRKHNGMTPLMVACKRGHYGIVQRLLKTQKVNVNAQDSNGLTALHFSVQSNSVEIVCTLLLKGADPNISTPLITACASSNLQIVKELLKAKADVNGQDEDGTTALYMVSSNGDFRIIKKLLSSGANPNMFVKGTKWTPLIVASANGHIDVVKSLLKAKVDTHYQDVYGKTALHSAVQHNHVDIVNELVQANVNPTLTTTDGETALAIAMKQNPLNEDMVKMLREAMNAYYNRTEGHRLLTMLRTSTSKRKSDQYSLITADTQSLVSVGVVSHQKSLVSKLTVDSGISTGSKGTDTQSLASATSHDSGYHQPIPKLASTHQVVHDIPKHKDLPSLSPHEEEHTTSSTHEQDNS